MLGRRLTVLYIVVFDFIGGGGGVCSVGMSNSYLLSFYWNNYRTFPEHFRGYYRTYPGHFRGYLS